MESENPDKKIVVIIPALNEEKTISSVIKQIPRDFAPEVKVLVVDDGSTDDTREAALEAGAEEIIPHRRNMGLGVAFKTGLRKALEMHADVVVSIDADGQFDPREIPKLVEPIQKEEADMVTCSRFLKEEMEPEMPWIKRFGNHMFTFLINKLTGKSFTDTQCGFRAYSKEAAMKMFLFGRHTYTQEVFIELVDKGFRIKEIACNVKGEREGQSRVVHSIPKYVVKVLTIVTRSVRDYKPLLFFGSIGFVLLAIGTITGFGLFIRWLAEGVVSPYRSLLDLSILSVVIGFMVIVLGLVADMFDRLRQLQEEMIYELRKNDR